MIGTHTSSSKSGRHVFPDQGVVRYTRTIRVLVQGCDKTPVSEHRVISDRLTQ